MIVFVYFALRLLGVVLLAIAFCVALIIEGLVALALRIRRWR